MSTSRQFLHELQTTARLEFAERKQAEKVLARKAPHHLADLKTAATDEDVAVRRLAIEILRRQGSTREIVRFFLDRLKVEVDVKARRRIAAALGDLGEPNDCPILLDAFEHEEHRFVKASIALALGSIGFSQWTEEMRQASGNDGPLGEALRKAINSKRSHTETKEKLTPAVGDYCLQCYSGAEKLVARECNMKGLDGKRTMGSGWVLLHQLDVAAVDLLTQLRTPTGMLKLEPWSSEATDLAKAIQTNIANLVKNYGLPKDLTYRLALPKRSNRFDTQLLRSCCKLIGDKVGWINSPSNYEVLIEIKGLKDDEPRFFWRYSRWRRADRPDTREVAPASIHPSMAASLCLVALDYRSDQETPLTMADPCCGAGTILQEWDRLGLRGDRYGFDLDPRAVAMSCRNLSGMTNLSLKQGDMTRLDLKDGTLDVMIANLPFGLRVKHGSNHKLYQAFAAEAKRCLKPGGRLVAYTADAKAFENAWQGYSARPEIVAKLNLTGGMLVTIFLVIPNKV